MNRPVESRTVLTPGLERALLVATLVLFGAFTVVALAADGVAGIFDAITFNWLSVQIFLDLVIAIILIMIWVHRDARARGRNPWPWIVAAPFVGVFSPLVYLVVRSGEVDQR